MTTKPDIEHSLLLHPIGVIHTPYKDKYLAPRQPGAGDENVEGIITLYPHQNFEQALEDLDGFERIWILSWFHKNTEWKPKVLPPRSGRTKRGLFATRSPHRPNPIGISVCSVIKIAGLNIHVENPDLLDGTPILDIKPYIPYADAFKKSRAGWIDTLQNAESKYTVIQSSFVEEQARWLQTNYNIKILDHVLETLSRDPLPHSFRRTKRLQTGGYVIAIKSWRVLYTINENEVHIEKIESGYSQRELEKAKKEHTPLHDEDAHRGFHKKYSK